MTRPAPSLRSHQRTLMALVAAMASGQAAHVRKILAAVTPGGGKSLLPVIAAHTLIAAGRVDRVVWVVPRDSLRLQAEEAFADPLWRAAFGHALSVRAADNERDPARGLAGYVTTYQAVAAAPALHLAEARAHRTLLVVDEVHHLPVPGRPGADEASADEEAEAGAWSRAMLPVMEAAEIGLFLSGTLERADGRRILGLPYKPAALGRGPEIDLEAPGLAVIGYSRSQALAERAVLPVTFGAIDGEASWLEGGRIAGDSPRVGPHRLGAGSVRVTTRPALFTALRTGFARDLLSESFFATKRLRARRRSELGLPPGKMARGLGKLLVVAPDQASARAYLTTLRSWMPAGQGERDVRLATSGQGDAHAALAAFRLTAEPAVLVTVAMAYEGLDAPEVAVVAALTHIRSRPWLEQMLARATRVDPHAGPYDNQQALIFHPDDPLFARFRLELETEQGSSVRPKRERPASAIVPERTPWRDEDPGGITPLESNAIGLRYALLRPRLTEPAPVAPAPEPPSVTERTLRQRLAVAVASQAVEDEASLRVPRGGNLAHRYNAVLKRVLGKGRATMTLPELEAALAWLERNRLSDHLDRLDGDARYAWSARQRRSRWQPERAAGR
ncbi:DEAD/DEAH box helicase family protein [Methylobacterium sp. ARG-1]|uniref:DEAD/DEAH box helicase n=1 Tax=Methylobacterium sp. ARG-1 TaxID=1692501 RepID=UPI0009EAE5A7|nr:DEAD/DEAH box helicase family protein [Methylobacterium sp. ARG-1]